MKIDVSQKKNDIRVMTLDYDEGKMSGTCPEEFDFNIDDEISMVFNNPHYSFVVKSVTYEPSLGRYEKPHKRFIVIF